MTVRFNDDLFADSGAKIMEDNVILGTFSYKIFMRNACLVIYNISINWASLTPLSG